MDLCLEHCDRFGEPGPKVTTRQLAEKVVDLYWSHTTPFDSTEVRAVLDPALLEVFDRFNAHRGPESREAATHP